MYPPRPSQPPEAGMNPAATSMCVAAGHRNSMPWTRASYPPERLDQKIKASQKAGITLPKPEHFVQLVQEKLARLDSGTKRIAPEALDVKVSVDGHNVEVVGVIPVPDYVIATPQTGLSGHNNIELLPFSVRALGSQTGFYAISP